MGIANSRMKDFYDLWALPKAVGIDMKDLADAILGTFERRNTLVPATCPVGLSAEFTADPDKMTQ
nr:nucleotidyl transferase AbiEii/AbiGii toxin family protein [Pseudotabrizicola algicola]